MKQYQKKVVHAQISSPVFIRKTLLEASILSIENLKILKNIRQIKRLKSQLKLRLRELNKEMQDLLIKFEEVIPHTDDLSSNLQRIKEEKQKIKEEINKEEGKRHKQEDLMVKTFEKEKKITTTDNHLYDFDIEKLKEKINKL